jgi:seryl-tRNA synthetase
MSSGSLKSATSGSSSFVDSESSLIPKTKKKNRDKESFVEETEDLSSEEAEVQNLKKETTTDVLKLIQILVSEIKDKVKQKKTKNKKEKIVIEVPQPQTSIFCMCLPFKTPSQDLKENLEEELREYVALTKVNKNVKFNTSRLRWIMKIQFM